MPEADYFIKQTGFVCSCFCRLKGLALPSTWLWWRYRGRWCHCGRSVCRRERRQEAGTGLVLFFCNNILWVPTQISWKRLYPFLRTVEKGGSMILGPPARLSISSFLHHHQAPLRVPLVKHTKTILKPQQNLPFVAKCKSVAWGFFFSHLWNLILAWWRFKPTAFKSGLLKISKSRFLHSAWLHWMRPFGDWTSGNHVKRNKSKNYR